MTQPTPPGDSPTADTSRRYRPGQLVGFRTVDPTSGDPLTGNGLVVRVDGDQADVAIVVGWARVPVEQLTGRKPDELPNPLPAPEPAEDTSGS